MRYLRSFVLFWYRFVVGDDWIAAGIVMGGFLGTYGLTQAGWPAFWLLPTAVMISLGLSLSRLLRSNARRKPHP